MTARRRPFTSTLLALTIVGTITGAAACASTTYEDDTTDGTPATDPNGTAPATTEAPVSGTAAELLPQLADEASGLSRLMIDGGDDQASALRIASLWEAVREEVAGSRPELVGDFDANVGRCASAVEFNRAADADKAARNLRALVDAYLA